MRKNVNVTAIAFDFSQRFRKLVLYELQPLTSSEVHWPECYHQLWPGKKLALSNGQTQADGGTATQEHITTVGYHPGGERTIDQPHTKGTLLIMDSQSLEHDIPHEYDGPIVHHNWFIRHILADKAASRLVIQSIVEEQNLKYILIPPFVVIPKDTRITKKRTASVMLFGDDPTSISTNTLKTTLKLRSTTDDVVVKRPKGTRGENNAFCTLDKLADHISENTATDVCLIEKAVAAIPNSDEKYLTGRIAAMIKTGETTEEDHVSLGLAYQESHDTPDSHQDATLIETQEIIAPTDDQELRTLCLHLHQIQPLAFLKSELARLQHETTTRRCAALVAGEVLVIKGIINSYIYQLVLDHIDLNTQDLEFSDSQKADIKELLNLIETYDKALKLAYFPSNSQHTKVHTRITLLALLIKHDHFLDKWQCHLTTSTLPTLLEGREHQVDPEQYCDPTRREQLGYPDPAPPVPESQFGYESP